MDFNAVLALAIVGWLAAAVLLFGVFWLRRQPGGDEAIEQVRRHVRTALAIVSGVIDALGSGPESNRAFTALVDNLRTVNYVLGLDMTEKEMLELIASIGDELGVDEWLERMLIERGLLRQEGQTELPEDNPADIEPL